MYIDILIYILDTYICLSVDCPIRFRAVVAVQHESSEVEHELEVTDSAGTLSATSRIREPAGRSVHERQGLHPCITRRAVRRKSVEWRVCPGIWVSRVAGTQGSHALEQVTLTGEGRRSRTVALPGSHRRSSSSDDASCERVCPGWSRSTGTQGSHALEQVSPTGEGRRSRTVALPGSEHEGARDDGCHNLQSGGPEAWHSGFYLRSVCSHFSSRTRPPCVCL